MILEAERRAEIITFYSYKGGTGRSMLLANVAWLLASSGKRVLAVDWDLEAPGLHRYFHPFLREGELESAPGVIDMMSAFASAAVAPVAKGSPAEGKDWYRAYADIMPYVVPLDWRFENGGVLDFIPAGRFGPSYAERVAAFDWQELYERKGGGDFMEAVKESMRAEYDVVLVDSRTGLSDTAGLCTVQLPDKLVVCFTFNHQSIEGAAGVARSVLEQRGDRPLIVLPVALRVEDGERDKLDRSRRFARAHFADTIARLQLEDTAAYWEDCEIPHKVGYAYEEILASFGDGQSSVGTMLAAVERVIGRMTPAGVPRWTRIPDDERRRVLRAFEMRAIQPPEREYDVFICYSPEALAYATEIARLLAGRHIRAWLDHSELRPGDEIAAVTESALKRSLSLVAILATAEAEPPEEVGSYILSRANLPGPRPVIPVVLANGRPATSSLATLKAIDAARLAPERVVDEIARALGRQAAAPTKAIKLEPATADAMMAVANYSGAHPVVPSLAASTPLPSPRRSRTWVFAIGGGLAALALLFLVFMWGGTRPVTTRTDAGSGGNTGLDAAVTSSPAEAAKATLLAAARFTKDPLQRALILREIPRAVFPPEEAQLLLKDARLPAAVFRGKFNDVRFDTSGERLVLSGPTGATVVPSDGRGAPIALESKAPPLRIAAFARDTVLVADRAGVVLWKPDGGKRTQLVAKSVPDVADVVEGTELADPDALVLGGPDGARGTRNAIFVLDLGDAGVTRWFDLRDPVLAMGFDPRRAIVYVTASGMYTLPRPGQPAPMKGLLLVPSAGTPVAVIGSKWSVLADLNSGTYSALAFEKGPPLTGRMLGLTAIAADTRVAIADREAVTVLDDARAANAQRDQGGAQGYAPSAGRPTSIATSGDWLLAGSSAGTVDLWKIGNGTIPMPLAPASEQSIVKVAFSRDGRHALALSSDGTVRTWNVDTKASLDGVSPAGIYGLLESVTSACLTPEERVTLLGESARTANEAYSRCVTAATGAQRQGTE